jgi:hypothetical protein
MKGFKQGFGEAQSILKDMGLLDKGLDQDIGQTYERVHQGAVDLEKKFMPGLPGSMSAEKYPGADKDVGAATQDDAVNGVRDPGLLSSLDQRDRVELPQSSASYQSYEFKREQSFEFELTTKDGDKVKILASSLEKMAAQAESAASGGARYDGLSFQSESGRSFYLSVEGDLNADELTAINQLLEQVVDLAGDFYSGDIGSAFTKATQLGYDASQIADFSVNLSQTTQSKAVAAYEDVGPSSPWDKPSVGAGLDRLGGFVKDLLDSIEAVKDLKQPASLVTDLLKSQVNELDAKAAGNGSSQANSLQNLLGTLDL